jgi:hypothetical protein
VQVPPGSDAAVPAASAARGSPEAPNDLLPQLQLAMAGGPGAAAPPAAESAAPEPPSARNLLARLLPDGRSSKAAGQGAGDSVRPSSKSYTAGWPGGGMQAGAGPRPPPGPPPPGPPPGSPMPPAVPPSTQPPSASQQSDLLGPLLAAGRGTQGQDSAQDAASSAPAAAPALPSPQKPAAPGSPSPQLRSTVQGQNASAASTQTSGVAEAPRSKGVASNAPVTGQATPREALRCALLLALQDDHFVDVLGHALATRGFQFRPPNGRG